MWIWGGEDGNYKKGKKIVRKGKGKKEMEKAPKDKFLTTSMLASWKIDVITKACQVTRSLTSSPAQNQLSNADEECLPFLSQFVYTVYKLH